MRKLTFGMNLSVDGYIAAPGDDLGWSVPSDELFQWWRDRAGATGLALYGRKLWAPMSPPWPTAVQRQPGRAWRPRRPPRARRAAPTGRAAAQGALSARTGAAQTRTSRAPPAPGRSGARDGRRPGRHPDTGPLSLRRPLPPRLAGG